MLITHSHQRRVLGDLGIDIRPWEHSVLELNYSDYSLLNRGFPGWFSYSEKRLLPPAPDPTRVGYGQPYARIDLRTRTASARIKHDLSEQWAFPGRGAQSGWLPRNQHAGQQPDIRYRSLYLIFR